MFHSNTERLIDYWRTLRGDLALPARSSVDPTDFVAMAPRTFIIARDDGGEFAFRLAGEQLIDLHDQPLHGEPLQKVWRQVHRRRLSSLLEAALAAGEPLVISAEAWSADAAHLRLEICLLYTSRCV